MPIRSPEPPSASMAAGRRCDLKFFKEFCNFLPRKLSRAG
jgi:hypothetical protein